MGTPKQPSLAPAHALGVRKSDPGIRSLGSDAGGRRWRPAGRLQGWDLAWGGPAPRPTRDLLRELIGCALSTSYRVSTAQSMFQIPEFEPSEQEDSSTAGRGLGPSLTGDQSGPCLAPALLGSIGHQQGQAANSSHHGGAGATETRSRHSSYPAGSEEDEGMEEELSPFRGRSRSAPPNLWAAQRYGRELRRMSDEFEGSFKGLPRPKSAGTATQMRQSASWTRIIQSWWDRNLGKGGSTPSQ
ncbi:bcl2-associated agonist of cell death isoform X2 [Sigmodon hispidus]